MRKSTSGFTIVELLIVIVVIAILAAISVVAYTGIQTRARATAIVSDIKATEKALNAYKVASGAGSWWRETDTAFLNGGTASIPNLISNNAGLRDFLQKAPTNEGLGTTQQWGYDNDGDTHNGCSAGSTGVNIYVGGVTNMDVAQAVDDAIDDGNLSCGKVWFYSSSSWLTYSLARNENQ